MLFLATARQLSATLLIHIDVPCGRVIIKKSPATPAGTSMETPFITLAALARDLSLSEKHKKRRKAQEVGRAAA